MKEKETTGMDNDFFNEDPQNVEDSKSNDFFEKLDAQVNGIIYDDKPSQKEQPKQTTSEKKSPDMEDADDSDVTVETLQKRYSDSSREAIRLNKKIKEIEPYMPILDAMREDPNLISHVRNYFEGGGQAPNNIKQQLNLDEDFVFSADEALENPNSDSGKLLNHTIEGIVQKRLNSVLNEQKRENERVAKEQSFRQKMNLNDEEWEELVDYAKSTQLTFEDIYYLKNRGKREQNIAKNANNEVSEQMKKVRSKPQSLASAGSQKEPEKSPDRRLFDDILEGDGIKSIEEAFLG